MADQQINTNVVLTADTRQYSQQMVGAQQSTASTQASVDKLITSLDNLAKKAGQGLMIVSAGTVATLTAAGVAAARFDSQLGSLKANAAITDRSMQGMTNQINRLRQDLPLTTDNVIALVESLQKMGVNPSDMEGLVKTFTRLSAATGENLGQLAQGTVQLQMSMGTLPSSTNKFADSLAGLSANMGVSATSTLSFANSIAPIARTVGMTQQEVLGFSAAFAKSGQDGFIAGNVMTQLIQNISRASRYGTKDLEMYANVANMTTEAFQEMSSADQIVKIFNQINDAGPDAVKILDRMGFEGARATRAITGAVQSGNLNQAMAQAGISTGALDKGAGAAMEGLSESTQKLRNSLAVLSSEIGGPLTGAFRIVVDAGTQATQVLTGMLGPVSGIINAIGLIAAPVAGAAGGILGNIGMVAGGALAYSLLKSPMAAGAMAARGRTGGGRFTSSIASFQAGKGGPVQRGLFRTGMFLGGDVRGAMGNAPGRARGWAAERFPADTDAGRNLRMAYGEFRKANAEAALAREAISTARTEAAARLREQAAGTRESVARAGLGPRLAASAAVVGSNIAGFTRAGWIPLTAGTDITNRAWREQDRADPRRGQAPWTAPGTLRGIWTGRMPAGTDAEGTQQWRTTSYRDAMRETTHSMREFGRELTRTTGGIAALGAREVGRGAAAAGRGLGRALSAPLSMMGGPAGLALIGGMAGLGYVSDVRARNREERERIETNDMMTNSYNEYASALGLATRAVTDFTSAVGGASQALPGERASGRAVTTGLVARAQTPGYQVTNEALRGMTQEQAAAYMESIYSYGQTPPEISRTATTDLIKQFGAGGAQSVIGQATAGGNRAISMFPESRPFWDIRQNWSASGAQSTALNELVLPAMRAQVDQAVRMYGGGSTEARKTQLSQVEQLLGEMRNAPSGESQALLQSIAATLGTDTKNLGIGSSGLAWQNFIGQQSPGQRIATAPNEREAMRQLLLAMKESSSEALYQGTLDAFREIDPEMVKAVEDGIGGALAPRAEHELKVNLARVTPEGFLGEQESIRVQKMFSQMVGDTTMGAIFTGENEKIYADFIRQEGNAAAQYKATEALLMDVSKSFGAGGVTDLATGTSPESIGKLQLVIDQMTSNMEAAADPSESFYVLSSAARDAATALQQVAMSRANIFQQAGGVIGGAISANQADLSVEGATERLQESRTAFEGMRTNIEDMFRSAYKAIIDFEHQIAQQTENRTRQLAYQEEDFALNRSRNFENFARQRGRAEADYARQRAYSQEDFNRQRDFSQDDFERSRRRNQDDFNRSRRRSEEDFAHQQVMMTRQAVNAMQDMYSRMTTQRTWDAQNLLVNVRDQAQRMEEQQRNLAALREQGLSGDAISFLGLNQFQNQGQVARMVSDVMADPSLIRQLNEAISGRIDLAEMFVFDQDSEQWKEMQRSFELSSERQEEDFARSMARGNEDFNRAMDRNAENFSRSMDRMDEMHGISMDRQAEDFNRVMEQGASDFARMMDRNETEWAISLVNMRENFSRQFEIVTADMDTMQTTVMSKLTGTAQKQYIALSGVLNVQWSHIQGLANMIASEFPKILAPLVGGETNYQALVELGVFGKASTQTPRRYSDVQGPAGSSGNLWGRGAPDDSALDVSNAEIYDRILNAQKRQGTITGNIGTGGASGSAVGGVFSGGGSNPLDGANYRLTSRFGMRTNPVTGRYELHNGNDLAAPTGTPIYAYAPGVVSHAGIDRWSGNVVQIEHGGGMRTRYHHMSRVASEVGQVVNGGQLIGYVGSTGNSTGPHLHFSVFQNGKAVDSLPYIGGAKILGGKVDAFTTPQYAQYANLPSKADVLQTIVQSEQFRSLEGALAWGPLTRAMPPGRLSLMVGSYWAGQYNPGAKDDSLRPENTDWYARGSIFSSPKRIGVGEQGPEAVIPLSGRGADFMADVISRFAIKGAENIRTAGRQTAAVQQVTYYQQIDSGNHFHGKIEAKAEDPNRLIGELERKARMSKLARSHR